MKPEVDLKLPQKYLCPGFIRSEKAFGPMELSTKDVL